TIDSDAGENECEAAEQAKQDQRYTAATDGILNELVHGGDGRDRLVAIYGCDHRPDGRGERGGIHARFDKYIHFVRSTLRQGPVDFESGRIVEPVHARIVDDTDDGSPYGLSFGIG